MNTFTRLAAIAAATMALSAGTAALAQDAAMPADLKAAYDAAVKEGGGVFVYSQMVPTTLEGFAAQWNRRFPGVKMEYVRLTTAPLIERVNARYGWRCIGKIVIKQGPVPKLAHAAPRRSLDPAMIEQASQRIGTIEDAGLRDALVRLGAGILSDSHKKDKTA